MSSYTRYSTRPQRVAHAIMRESKRGNPSLVGTVDLHAGQLSRAELLSVLRLLFEDLSRMSRMSKKQDDDEQDDDPDTPRETAASESCWSEQ